MFGSRGLALVIIGLCCCGQQSPSPEELAPQLPSHTPVYASADKTERAEQTYDIKGCYFTFSGEKQMRQTRVQMLRHFHAWLFQRQANDGSIGNKNSPWWPLPHVAGSLLLLHLEQQENSSPFLRLRLNHAFAYRNR